MKAQKRLAELETLLRGSPYRPISWLGRGAVADVFVVRHTLLGKEFALKMVHEHLAIVPGYVGRLRREARALGQMDPTYVVRVVDFEMASNGAPYLVLERLKGETLARELATRGKPALRTTLTWMDGVLRGLETAHGLGVVHRDLSPENVFLREVRGAERQIKILDFGLAGVSPEVLDCAIKGDLSTATGTLLGTPGYASPEALAGEKLDVRADVYSAGVVLFELLTGLGPFDVDESGVPAPSVYAEGLPSEFDEIVLSATRTERDQRFQTASALRLALGHVRAKLESR